MRGEGKAISALDLSIDWYNLGGADPCTPAGGRFYRAVVTGRSWRTAKGLRVGDSLQRLRRLFPRAERHGAWQWLVPRFYTVPGYRYPGLAAKLVHGRVAALAVTYPAGGD